VVAGTVVRAPEWTQKPVEWLYRFARTRVGCAASGPPRYAFRCDHTDEMPCETARAREPDGADALPVEPPAPGGSVGGWLGPAWRGRAAMVTLRI